jgi:hypothetical protein
MNDFERAAFLMSQVACAMAEIAGMQAENQHSMICGNGILYGEDAFAGVIEKYGIGHNAALTTLGLPK